MKIKSVNTPAENSAGGKKGGSFKGVCMPALGMLNWMNNNPALSACGVDMASMVIPRTIVETKNRGKQSGIETFIRESSSALINSLTGLIGFGAAALISGGINKKYGIKAQNIYASRDTIENMSEIWKSSGGEQKKFFESFLKNIQGLNGETWQGVSKEAQQKTAEMLMRLASETAANSKNAANSREILLSSIIKDTGAQNSFKLAPKAGGKEISAGLSELVDSAVSLSNAFKNKENLPEFTQRLIKNKGVSALLGLSICAALSVSVQPLNRYFTKKRTGRDAFVGTDTKEKDNSAGFKALKTAAGIGFPVFAVSTIGAKLKDLPAALQFNGKVPRINQFKLIYGTTIGSRLLFARDKDELRESIIKDTLGFCTWLIFGGFVSKIAARAAGGKEIINNPTAKQGGKGISYAAKWLMKSSVKSFNEILLPKAEKISENGRMLSFKELFTNADAETKKRIFKAAGAQAAGYLFSGIVLGMGITKLNIYITKKINERRKAQNKLQNEASAPLLNKEAQKFDTDFLHRNIQASKSIFSSFEG